MTTPHTIARRIATALLASPGLAMAHAGADAGMHHGFLAGLAHPFTGMDHLAAMVAVGLWSALALRRAWVAPLGFASMVLAGALLATAGGPAPAVIVALGHLAEPMVAASLLALGLLLASRVRLGLPAAVLICGGFALFHGAAHGLELGNGHALAGMVLATVLLHGLGMALGVALRDRSAWWPRLAGGAIALLGSALLLPMVAP